MSVGREVANHPPEFASAYEKWRASTLGRVTDEIEQTLIFDLLGDVSEKRIFDLCELRRIIATAGAVDCHVTGFRLAVAASKR